MARLQKHITRMLSSQHSSLSSMPRIRIVAFITKMFLTSRLTVSMGVKSALFITPIGMMLLIGAIIAVSSLSSDQRLIFYMFGVTSILVEVLRTSFNTPVLLTLMQPLPIHERLRAHNIVKGIMDPFAFFITGVVLLTVNYLGKKADLIHLCYTPACSRRSVDHRGNTGEPQIRSHTDQNNQQQVFQQG